MQSHPFADHRGLLWQKVQLTVAWTYHLLPLWPALEADKMSDFALSVYFCRNFCKNGDGTVEEIGFEEFLVVMSHFRPPSLHMTEEQRESLRREKLRCAPWTQITWAHARHDMRLTRRSYTDSCVFLRSFIQHARHRQRWDDHPGGVQTCKPPLTYVD